MIGVGQSLQATVIGTFLVGLLDLRKMMDFVRIFKCFLPWDWEVAVANVRNIIFLKFFYWILYLFKFSSLHKKVYIINHD